MLCRDAAKQTNIWTWFQRNETNPILGNKKVENKKLPTHLHLKMNDDLKNEMFSKINKNIQSLIC